MRSQKQGSPSIIINQSITSGRLQGTIDNQSNGSSQVKVSNMMFYQNQQPKALPATYNELMEKVNRNRSFNPQRDSETINSGEDFTLQSYRIMKASNQVSMRGKRQEILWNMQISRGKKRQETPGPGSYQMPTQEDSINYSFSRVSF